MLAGLEAPDGGQVRIDGRPVQGVGTERAVIFQEPRLLPWLTVLSNVAFGLEVRGMPKAEAEAQPRQNIRLVGLGEFEDAFPAQLSGGMRQRVGIARALTAGTGILLMDEAFSALDPLIRREMQEQLVELQAVDRGIGQRDVRLVHRIEAAAEDADAALRVHQTQSRAGRKRS